MGDGVINVMNGPFVGTFKPFDCIKSLTSSAALRTSKLVEESGRGGTGGIVRGVVADTDEESDEEGVAIGVVVTADTTAEDAALGAVVGNAAPVGVRTEIGRAHV